MPRKPSMGDTPTHTNESLPLSSLMDLRISSGRLRVWL